MLEVRKLRAGEVALLKHFAPPEWNVDLSTVFGRHFGEAYFHAIAAELDGRVVGCASGLVQGSVGWLGNIIVLPECRGHGIGAALTRELVTFFRTQGVRHQVLVATTMGEPVYRRLGFEVVSYYIFFTRQNGPAVEAAPARTRPFAADDEPALFALDRAVTGESRGPFLRRYLQGGWVHASPSGALDGYYLPQIGTGLLIAADDEAGFALLGHRVGQPGQAAVVPEQNTVATAFLQADGYVETSRAPRMALGPDIEWQPARVYCRGSGFCG